jgi:hypothetical protein
MTEIADIRLHARLGARGNRITSLTAQGGGSINTHCHVSQDLIFAPGNKIIRKCWGSGLFCETPSRVELPGVRLTYALVMFLNSPSCRCAPFIFWCVLTVKASVIYSHHYHSSETTNQEELWRVLFTGIYCYVFSSKPIDVVKSPPSSGLKMKLNKKPARSKQQATGSGHVGFAVDKVVLWPRHSSGG